MAPEFNRTYLKNGVTVVTERHPHTNAVCCAFYVNVGTRDEPQDMIGASHYVEHLVFKGTKNYSCFDIASSLEAVGGEINAYTTREYTCYHTTSLKEDLSLSIDVLGELVKDASFKKVDFEKERQVILQEIEMAKDQHEEYVFDVFFEKAFHGSQLGRPILGTEESLKKMTLANLKNYYKSRYSSEHIIVSVAGDVDHDQVVKLVEKKLAKLAVSPRLLKRKKPNFHPFIEAENRNSEQTHIIIGLPVASFSDPYRFEAYMLNAILGGGMTSRLYQRIREKHGWVYSIYSYLHSYTDAGLFMLYAATSNDLFKKVYKALYEELKRIKQKGLSQREINYFKKQVIGQLVIGSEDVENRMNSIALNEMVFKKYRPLDLVLDEIRAVDKQSMKEFIANHLDLNKLGVMVLGDLDPNKTKTWLHEFHR